MTPGTPAHGNRTSIGSRLLMALFVGAAGLLIFGIPLFLSAGSLGFWNGWLFLGATACSWSLILAYLAFKNPALFGKRTQVKKEGVFQRLVMSMLTLSMLLSLVTSGLDYRFRWSHVPLGVVIAFTLVMLLGHVLLFLATKENPFGSNIVEIQANQKVIDTGMYSVVRHPMYLAFTVTLCFSPLILGSYYALFFSLLMPFLLAMRIRDEERVLRKELEGYESYMQKVRYRYLPFIW